MAAAALSLKRFGSDAPFGLMCALLFLRPASGGICSCSLWVIFISLDVGGRFLIWHCDVGATYG